MSIHIMDNMANSPSSLSKVDVYINQKIVISFTHKQDWGWVVPLPTALKCFNTGDMGVIYSANRCNHRKIYIAYTSIYVVNSVYHATASCNLLLYLNFLVRNFRLYRLMILEVMSITVVNGLPKFFLNARKVVVVEKPYKYRTINAHHSQKLTHIFPSLRCFHTFVMKYVYSVTPLQPP